MGGTTGLGRATPAGWQFGNEALSGTLEPLELLTQPDATGVHQPDGIARVIDSPELAARLGAEARRQAEEKHTWREHTRRIVERLEEICP